MNESSRPKLIPSAIAISIGLLIWFVIPAPGAVKPEAWQLLALFVATIAAIIGKAMPIGALSSPSRWSRSPKSPTRASRPRPSPMR
jgi:di/tricarboxylate transporter